MIFLQQRADFQYTSATGYMAQNVPRLVPSPPWDMSFITIIKQRLLPGKSAVQVQG